MPSATRPNWSSNERAAMSFDLFAIEQALHARLASVTAGVPLVGMFDAVDLTADGASTTAAQLALMNFTPAGQVAASSRSRIGWSFDLYVDTQRASDADKASAAGFFSAAIGKLAGFELEPGKTIDLAQGQDSGTDGRVLRISFGFTVPVFVSGE